MILTIPLLWHMYSSSAQKDKNTEERTKNVKSNYWFDIDSPSGKITGKVGIDQTKQLTYQVNLNDQKAILPSKLGIVTDKGDIGHFVEIGNPTKNEVNVTYPSRENSSKAVDHHIDYVFPITHVESGFQYDLEMRVWDNGIGFRYVFPDGSEMEIQEESTSFTIPMDATAWYQMNMRDLQDLYSSKKVSEIKDTEILASLPTFELSNNQGYVSLTEANLSDYAGIAYKSMGNGTFKAHFWDTANGFTTKAKATPWRLAIIADNLHDSVNNTLVTNVSEPVKDKLKDAPWIHPGKAVWFNAYNKKTGEMDLPEARRVFEASNRLGIKHHIIGSGWRKWGEDEDETLAQVQKIVDLAKEYDVGIWLWNDTPDLDNSGDDNMYDDRTRQTFFKKVKEMGIVGLKLDHVQSETPITINLYQKIVEETAQLELMVLFHNSNKPTGLSRTYPNLMTKEAVRGMQYNLEATNSTIIPFTRLLGGGADFTPVNFTDSLRLGSGSWAHMLANTVIMRSSILTFIDSPPNLLENESSSFIASVPSVWDETIVLPSSKIGEVAAFVRRSGEDWYVAVQNASKGERSIEIDLSFLPEHITFQIEQYFDVLDNPASFKKEFSNVISSDTLIIPMRSGGGFAAKITNQE